MKLAVEIYANKLFSLIPGTYFKTSLWTGGKILPKTSGLDYYHFAALIASEKRLAGTGRRLEYTLNSFPAGMGAIEGGPAQFLSLAGIPDDLTLSIRTNSVLKADTLADHLGVRLLIESGKRLNIPLYQTGFTILRDDDYFCRVPLSTFINGMIFGKVC